MTERISKQLINQGLDTGLITFRMEEDNLVVQIGEGWFYINSEHGKTEKDYTEKQLIDMIHEAVNDEPINDENEDDASECLYYRYYLEERLTPEEES